MNYDHMSFSRAKKELFLTDIYVSPEDKKEIEKWKVFEKDPGTFITGCRSGFTCNCGAKIVMDSTGSGKAGTNDGDTYYVLGPCACLLPCPKCGDGGIRNLVYND